MNAREFRIRHGPWLKGLAKDMETVTAAVFKRKYGVDVRDCRVELKRLRELADARRGADDPEVRELVGLFAAMCDRKAD
jgi:hypothetical protein